MFAMEILQHTFYICKEFFKQNFPVGAIFVSTGKILTSKFRNYYHSCQWHNQRSHALRLTLADRGTGHRQHHRQTQGNPHLHGFKPSHIVVLQLKVATDPGIDALQCTASVVQPLPSIGVPWQRRKGAKLVLVDLDAYDAPFCILANATESMALLTPGTPLTGAGHRTVKLLCAAFSCQPVIRHLSNISRLAGICNTACLPHRESSCRHDPHSATGWDI